MESVKIELYESDLIYILNSICCTKKVLMEGKPYLYTNYFKKEHYNSYMYDLTLLQKMIGYRVNNKLYNVSDEEFLLCHQEYLKSNEKDFSFLFGKTRKRFLLEIANDLKERKKIEEYKKIRFELLQEVDLISTKKSNDKIFNKFYHKFLKRA